MKCNYCSKNSLVKKGKRCYKQRFRCNNCGKCQQESYIYKLYDITDDKLLKQLNAESVGILSIGRILGYSHGTIQRRILYLRSKVTKPIYCENRQIYELDEMCTYIGKNNPSNYHWIAYAINRKNNQVMDITFGARSSENLGKVVNTLKIQNPLKIITDKLAAYPKLIKPFDHDTKRYANNKIERCNLTLRTHLKRLSRRTICYSKSPKMLEACVILYLDYHYWKIKMK